MQTKRFALAALAAATLLCTIPATAQGPGWTANGKVVQIVVTAVGGINVRLQPQLTGCTAQSGYGETFASILPGHPGLKQMHANLLAAQLSGEPVALYLGDSACTVWEMVTGGW